jgi:hypothetical protein
VSNLQEFFFVLIEQEKKKKGKDQRDILATWEICLVDVVGVQVLRLEYEHCGSTIFAS